MGLLLAIDVYKGGVPLQHYEFSSDMQRIVRLGKLHSAQVKLDDPAVSRIHAIIELAAGQAMLVDMGADGGTMVNGKRVSKVRLNHGDQIQLGETVLVVGFGATVGHDALLPAAVSVSAGSPSSVTPASAPSGAAVPSAPGAFASAGAGAAGRYTSAGSAPVTGYAPQPASGPYTAASGFAGMAAGAAGVDTYAGAPAAIAGVRMQPSTQRLLAKLPELSPEAIAELERYAEYLRWRQGGGALPAVAAEPAVFSANGGEPERARTTGRHDTLSLVAEMKRDRRTRQLIVVGVMGVIVLVLLLLVLRDPPSNGAAAPPQARAPAQDQPGTGQSASAPETGAQPTAATPTPAPGAPPASDVDPSVLVYRLPKEQSLTQLAEELWQRREHAAILAKANPTVASTDTPVAKDTAVRIPRTTSYQVRSGDTLAVIAEKMLGRSDLYRLVQDANAEELPDPSQIEVGMILKVPLLHAELEKRLASSPSVPVGP